MEDKKLSRRSFLRGAATLAGAAGAVTIIPIAHAQKADKKAMQYQDTPKGAQQCDKCVYWKAPDACGIVEGKISPKGWCVAYNEKK